MLMIHNCTFLNHPMTSALLINWFNILVTSTCGCHNFLLLNKDKTEVLITGAKVQREILCTNLKSLAQNAKPPAKTLGVLLEPDLNFEAHISNLTKTTFYHLRNVVKVQPFLTQADTKRLMHALSLSFLVCPRKL